MSLEIVVFFYYYFCFSYFLFFLKKLLRRGREQWLTPVIPATREAETGELLEPGRQSLHRQRIGTHRRACSNTNNFSAEDIHDKRGLGEF